MTTQSTNESKRRGRPQKKPDPFWESGMLYAGGQLSGMVNRWGGIDPDRPFQTTPQQQPLTANDAATFGSAFLDGTALPS